MNNRNLSNTVIGRTAIKGSQRKTDGGAYSSAVTSASVAFVNLIMSVADRSNCMPRTPALTVSFSIFPALTSK